MSYGQSGHSNGPWQSQPAAGSSTYPSPPLHAPAHRGAQESQHPGWLARSLFWAALVIGALPALVLVPLASAGGAETVVLFSVGSIIASCLRLVVGTAAILLVKNTTWTRRLFGGGLFFLGSVALMVLTPLVSILITQTDTSASDQMAASDIVQWVLNSLFLAAVFCGWDIARNRRWWILLIGVVLAVVLTAARMFIVNHPAAAMSPSGALGAAIQGGWLVLVFGSLGLFHLLGRIRGASVPPPAPKPQPVGQWGPLPSVGGASDWPRR
ncbi:MAG: hypothetical protein ACTH2U_10935 [Brevibacterium sp.]